MQVQTGTDAPIRCFSISAFTQDWIEITVKQHKEGQVSKYLNRKLKQGDSLRVSKPNGKFCIAPHADSRKTYYFFAAGSGITPLYCMLNAILKREPLSHVCLLYSNTNEKHTIFADALQKLANTFTTQFHYKTCHTSPSWFSDNAWRTGRITPETVEAFFDAHPPYAQNTAYFICGPGDFIPTISTALKDIDVPASRISYEHFAGPSTTKAKLNNNPSNLKVDFFGQHIEITINSGETLLQALIRNDIDAPRSCEAGMCGTCRCKVTQGKVEMLNNCVLDESAVNNGETLACQALPQSNIVKIKYMQQN